MFSGRHTAENIAAHFQETVEQFNIAGKVSYIVTDNAAYTKNADNAANIKIGGGGGGGRRHGYNWTT